MSLAKNVAAAAGAAVVGLAAQDLLQKEHALRRNFPLLARARYGLEAIGPELRQYIVTGNDEERPRRTPPTRSSSTRPSPTSRPPPLSTTTRSARSPAPR